MKVFEILNESMSADDVERFFQSIKRIVPDEGKQRQILKIIDSIPADERYDDDDVETMFLNIKKVVSPEEGEKILALINLNEAAIRQWRRTGKKLVRKYRCMSGKKKGKLVASPGKCGERKDPQKVRTGRKVMRSKKGIIKRKSKIAKRQQISKMVTRLNARLMGKDVKNKKVDKHKTMS